MAEPAHSGINSHTGSSDHPGLGSLTPLASGGHVGYGGLTGDPPSWESIHARPGTNAAKGDSAPTRDPGNDWGPPVQAQNGSHVRDESGVKAWSGGGPRYPTNGTPAQAEHSPQGSPMRIISHAQGSKGGGVAGLGGLVRGVRGPISTAQLLQLGRAGGGKQLGSVHARNHWAPPHKADVEGMLVLGKGSGTQSHVPPAHHPQPQHGGGGVGAGGGHGGYGGVGAGLGGAHIGHGGGGAGSVGGGRPVGGSSKLMGGGGLYRGSSPSMHPTPTPLPIITEHQRTSFMPQQLGGMTHVAAATSPAHFAPHHPTSPPQAYAHVQQSSGPPPRSPPDRGSNVPVLPYLPSAPHPPSSVQAAMQRHQQATLLPTRPAGYNKGGRVRMGSTSKSQPLPPSKQLAQLGGTAVYASAEGLGGARQDSYASSPPRQLSPTAHR
ncbi:hypothetical protein DUNSADRAFT_14961 [Dunaliella salina]|uniref:Uncharacterized protein n=1 Tax=Dunaliella salina TaxID=3046 RepID=A0ABQ7G6A7_DUNSA|nr:hypothetical protein DUNSADRAFT_14961 [Dunaliella salina]|eukprot:KAF5830144.1 hypothetical protein DUNSADRAFT_14961 [Dunaliella salina]